MPSFSFIDQRKYLYGVALLLIAFSFFAPSLFGIRLGIDMTGGVQIEYQCEIQACDIDQVRAAAESTRSTILAQDPGSMNEINVYKISGQETVVVEAGFVTAGRTDAGVETLKSTFRESLSSHLAQSSSTRYTFSRYVNVGESFGAYIKQSGYITLTIAILAISIYIQYAFSGAISGMASWPFAVVTGLSLIHDLIIVFGLYVATAFFFPEFRIDTFFFTAMLTILGYSINDTIVVLDRIRSNLREKTGKMDLAHLIDASIWDTMRRSLFTSFTIVIVLVALFFFGPDTLRGFVLVLLYGTIVGTYSSVCIASPLLYDISHRDRK